MGTGSDSGSVSGVGNTVSSGSPAGERANTDSNADNSSLAEEKVELLCNDQVLDPSMDLRTVSKLDYWIFWCKIVYLNRVLSYLHYYGSIHLIKIKMKILFGKCLMLKIKFEQRCLKNLLYENKQI